MKRDHPDQLYLFARTEVISLGGGNYKVITHKPEQWIWTCEAARICNVSQDAIRDWIHKRLVVGRRMGPRRFQVRADSLEQFLAEYNHLL